MDNELPDSPSTLHEYNYEMEAPVDKPPRRVVSLVPSTTESLFDLNVGDRLIAITDYCTYPADKVARLPRIGGTKTPDIDRIIELQPDLVFANREENRKADVERLQAVGIPVWVTYPTTVREAFNVLWTIMHIFDEPSMVERVRAIEWTCDWLERLDETRERPCRVFAPIWNDPLMTFNHHTYAHDLLRVCGGENVYADLGSAKPDQPEAERESRYPRLTLEAVEHAQPDVILLPDEPYTFEARHIPMFAALDTPASRNGAIYLIEGSLLTWHGTRVARAFEQLPSLLCAFENDG